MFLPMKPPLVTNANIALGIRRQLKCFTSWSQSSSARTKPRERGDTEVGVADRLLALVRQLYDDEQASAKKHFYSCQSERLRAKVQEITGTDKVY